MDTEDRRRIVAFLGPKASYTHQAALSLFPPTSNHTLHPLPTIQDVFTAVQSSHATHGVIPFENSSNGSVVFTLDLFVDASNKYPDICVTGETYLPVKHCLVGFAPPPPPTLTEKKDLLSPLKTDLLSSGQVTPTQLSPSPPPPRAKPICDLSKIKKLYTHPQAWGQCKVFLGSYLKGAERLDVSSTSRAAELVATFSNDDEEKFAHAAVSSKIAAEIHGLDVLAEGIEDFEGNATRFLVLSRRSSLPPLTTTTAGEGGIGNEGEGGGGGGGGGDGLATHKTLLHFTVDQSAASPGALADCLEVFRRNGLDLTSINTRPVPPGFFDSTTTTTGKGGDREKTRNWEYVFFVECRGRRRWSGEGTGEGEAGRVDKALRELSSVAKTSRWLGSFEDKLK